MSVATARRVLGPLGFRVYRVLKRATAKQGEMNRASDWIIPHLMQVEKDIPLLCRRCEAPEIRMIMNSMVIRAPLAVFDLQKTSQYQLLLQR